MPSIEKLIDIFKKFPTVGPRTAGRFVYYLIKLPKDQIDELSNALQELKNRNLDFSKFVKKDFKNVKEFL